MTLESNESAIEKIECALKTPISETEAFILNATKELMGLYSYVDNQTYPRPNHPDKLRRKDIYFTMVAVLISLRTTLENEIIATTLFLNKFKTPEDVLRSSPEEIASVIRSAGMPRKKAETILKATKYVVDVLGNDWVQFANMPISDARKSLLKIPGIGLKSADCILELGLDLPTIVIDINMLRVILRLFGLDGADSPNLSDVRQLTSAKKQIEDNLRKDGFIYKIVHTMFLLHGKNICKSKPNCAGCVFKDKCAYYNSYNTTC